jgi:hypothetical protein
MKLCMSSHVGTIIVGGFLQDKEVVLEELGGQHLSRAADTNLPFDQGKPRCIPILCTHRVLYYYFTCNVLCTYV